ncbi:NAD(P)/FAD-dependent oxidoreductase [Pseudarthrobacter sulfonivorans]|uniref:flavin monoamine oxidase family protein n=1 Tax=Pseudarthrobacter sulfonivorans TaxID=121292 RepID=UPI002858638A|nr:NAD(P)/FAD-dependent oxidoreductase [Pseudarthrobacter sulfonivorans]MDR6414475.1 monoamine oxidase [Pseudarthrobacter sulfonivorans]
MTDIHDVVVVGAGPAGLALAYDLRDLDLDIQVLEAGTDIGGRTRSVQLAGAAVNTGAMFIYRGTRAETLAKELRQDTVPFHPATYGVHIDGVTSVAGSTPDVVEKLPLPQASKDALVAFMDGLEREYRENVSDGAITGKAAGLGNETVASRLEGLPGPARSVIEAAVRGGSVGDAAQLSAKYALRYLASYIAHEWENRLYPVNGMQDLPRALAANVGSRTTITTGLRVHSIRESEDVLEVTAGDGESRRVLLARHVVMAVPAPQVAGICRQLPGWKHEALKDAETPGSTTVTIAANIEGLPEFADWSFVSTVGKKFDCIINPQPGVRAADGIVRFTCYGNSAGFIPGIEGDEQQIQAWVDDFLTVAPELRGRIVGAAAATWEHCFSVLSPKRNDALPALQRSVGNIHFAGDYTSETAGSHGAYDEARRVAQVLRASLAEPWTELPAGHVATEFSNT